MMTKFETAVRNKMDKAFNENELREFCFELSLDWDNLSGDTKVLKIQEIFGNMVRRGKEDELISTLREKRPEVVWPDPPTETELKYDKTDAELDEAINNYLESLRKEVGYVPIFGRGHEPIENYNNILANVKLQPISTQKTSEPPHKLFVLGKPGTGKTTFLKYLALLAINGEINKTPVFIKLKELSFSGKSINDFIAHLFKRHQFANAENYIQNLLEKGDGLLIFDGLDEVNENSEQRKQLLDDLNNFAMEFSKCEILISSRKLPPQTLFPQFYPVEVADFNPSQIKAYIEHWFKDNRKTSEKCKAELFRNKKNTEVRELAKVPLLLSLICLEYEKTEQFPQNRSELYEKAIATLLDKWDREKNLSREKTYSELTVSKLEDLHAFIAFNTLKNKNLSKEGRLRRLVEDYLQKALQIQSPSGEKILQEIEIQPGLIVEVNYSLYAFLHQALQDYFAARYIVVNEDLEQQLTNHVGDEDWNEVFLFVAEILDDATEFCKKHLRTVQSMIAEDKELLALLGWLADRQSLLNIPYKDEAMRPFLLWCTFDRNPQFLRKGIFDEDFDINRAIFNISRREVLSSAYKLAQTLDLNLALAINLHISHKQANLVYDPEFSDTLYAPNFSQTFDQAIKVADRFNLSEFKRELEVLSIPDKNDPLDIQKECWQTLEKVLEKYALAWNPYEQVFTIVDSLITNWNLSEQQMNLLSQYLEANLLLVRCLEVADMPSHSRELFKSKILLPLL